MSQWFSRFFHFIVGTMWGVVGWCGFQCGPPALLRKTPCSLLPSSCLLIMWAPRERCSSSCLHRLCTRVCREVFGGVSGPRKQLQGLRRTSGMTWGIMGWSGESWRILEVLSMSFDCFWILGVYNGSHHFTIFHNILHLNGERTGIVRWQLFILVFWNPHSVENPFNIFTVRHLILRHFQTLYSSIS